MPIASGGTEPTTEFWAAGKDIEIPTPATISGGDQGPVVHPGFGDEGDPAEPDRLQQRPDDEEGALAEAVDELAGDRGDEEERRGPGQEAEAGAERVVAEPRLEELGHEEDRAEEAADGAEDRRVAGREGARAEEAHRQHRRPRPQLEGGEGGRAGRAAAAKAPSTSALPQPASLPRTSPQTRPRTPPLTSASPGRSSALSGPWLSGIRRQHQRDQRQPDRHVEPEDPLPGDPLGDRAADQRPAGDREPVDGEEDAERAAALLRREGGADQGEGERRHRRGAGALDRAGGDQRADRGRHRAGRRGERRRAPIPAAKTRRRPNRSPSAAAVISSTAKLRL